METIYYSLDAKRLTVCGEAADRRASGGQETVCYAFVPRPRRPVMPAGGKVVDAALRTGAILCRGKNMQKTIDKLS